MKPNERLSEFIHDGLRAGHTREDLRGALDRAGWPGAEIEAALSLWTEDGLLLPVPRPRPSFSGRDLVMFGLFAITLVVVIWHLVQLSFALIETWLPGHDPARDGWHASAIRWSVSTLVVVLPLFAWLTWRIEASSLRSYSVPRSPLQQRFGAVAVLVAILVLMGNSVAVVYAGLSGDLTAQYVAKATVVGVVAGLLIAWFRGYTKGP